MRLLRKPPGQSREADRGDRFRQRLGLNVPGSSG